MTFSVVKTRAAWFICSAILLGTSVALLIGWGLKQGLDFTGGSSLMVRFSARPSVVEMQKTLAETKMDLGEPVVQPIGETDMSLRFKTVTEAQHQQLFAALKQATPSITELRFESVGPVIGQELRQKSVQGLVIALLLILLYIAYAFRKVSAPVQSWKYGVVTMVAAAHDVLIPMGVFVYLGKFHGVEIGTPFIAAILTILGYSITDTIVVMDRVRENLPKMRGAFEEVVDFSLKQTFLRSFYTSATTLITLLAIFFFGGQSLHEFTLAMIIGIVAGTYSSIFIAAPLLVTWNAFTQAQKNKK